MMLVALLTTGLNGRWRPGIGDPSVMGWVTELAYLSTSLLAHRASASARKPARVATTVAPFEVAIDRRLSVFWGFAAVALLLLGVNKQLDLQTWFTEVLRDLARAQGWYAVRRSYQVLFILAVLAGGVVGMVTVGYALRGGLRRVAGAVSGLGLVVVFVIVRAASFHHVDLWIGRGPVRLNWILELGGLALVGVFAWRFSRPRGQP